MEPLFASSSLFFEAVSLTNSGKSIENHFRIALFVPDYQLQSVVVWDLTGYTLLEKGDSLLTLWVIRRHSVGP